MSDKPQNIEEVLAVNRGEDLAQYRQQAAERADIWKEGDAYYDLPPDQWPKLQFNWDFSTSSKRFGLDGVSQVDFEKIYPDGLIAGWCSLSEFDRHLCHYSRRDGSEELWELGFKSALAYLIAYLRRGKPITPPIVAFTDKGEFVFRGGHHRYAAAKASGIKRLPIYLEPSNYAKASSLIALGCVQRPTIFCS